MCMDYKLMFFLFLQLDFRSGIDTIDSYGCFILMLMLFPLIWFKVNHLIKNIIPLMCRFIKVNPNSPNVLQHVSKYILSINVVLLRDVVGRSLESYYHVMELM